MSDLYTKVAVPKCGPGYACNGRKTRAEAIAEARRHFERQLVEAEEFLNTDPASLLVKVTRGMHRETHVEVLES
jgi:hypothetical protein